MSKVTDDLLKLKIGTMFILKIEGRLKPSYTTCNCYIGSHNIITAGKYKKIDNEHIQLVGECSCVEVVPILSVRTDVSIIILPIISFDITCIT